MYFAAAHQTTNAIILYDAGTFLEVGALLGHTARVSGLTFADHAPRLASTDDDNIKVWDLDLMCEIASLKAVSAGLFLAFNGDGTFLLESGLESTCLDFLTITKWDISAKSVHVSIDVFQQSNHMEAAFALSDSRIMSAMCSCVVLWDSMSGIELQSLECGVGRINGVVVNPSETGIVAAVGDTGVAIIDVDKGHTIHCLAGHERAAFYACFSGDGSRIVSTSADCMVNVWNACSGELVCSLLNDSGLSNVSLDWNGSKVAFTAPKAVQVYSVESEQFICELQELRHGRFSSSVVILL
jgi:WD40 repeat protein